LDQKGHNLEYPAMSTVRFFRHSTRFFRHHIPTEFVVLGIVESFVLIGSFYLGLELRLGSDIFLKAELQPFFPKAVIYSIVMLMSLIAFGAYQRQSSQSLNMMALRVAGSLLVGMTFLGMTFYAVPVFFLGRGVLALSVLVSFVGIMVVRILFARIAEKRDIRLRVLVLGAGATATLIKDAETKGELDGMNIVGYVPLAGDRDTEKEHSLVIPSESLIKYVEEKDIDEIVLAADDRRKGFPVKDLLDCKMSGISVLDLLSFFERETGKIRIDILHPSWLFLSDGFHESTFRRAWKRLFDIVFVLLLLPVVLPIMALVAVVILIESRGRGPVLYSQTRVSENGKLFRIHKFRSMVEGAEGDGVARWAAQNDSRITRVGSILRKYRFDELPQLFNVLKGEMSFVGPRPERPEFVGQLARTVPYYNERHRVKPGLSGWAQIRYPYGASEGDTQEKLQYDLYYVKNYSIFLDAFVLLQTLEVVLFGKGAR
jgi:sugar transferase (PEP-CTERM system associated)